MSCSSSYLTKDNNVYFVTFIQFSDREAESISSVLDGMILAANKLIFNLLVFYKLLGYFSLTILNSV